MKKKLLSVLLAGVMVLSLAACGGGGSSSSSSDGGDGGEKAESNGKKVGVAMPTQSSERWIKDGDNMKKQLEALGYKVDLQYAEDDIPTQTSQLETMIAQGVDCLVIAAIDSGALVNVLDQAKQANIPVIAYDRLLMDTDAVSYYASFDNEGVGRKIGEYIETKADLFPAHAGLRRACRRELHH